MRSASKSVISLLVGIAIDRVVEAVGPDGLRVELLANVSGLIDGAVYSSEIPWVKPHPEAFRAAMTAIGVTDAASCVFVGDRPYDDVHGAKSAGMRAVLVANSSVPSYDGAEPDAIITRLSELLRHLDAW